MEINKRRKLYHRTLSSHTDDLMKVLEKVKHPDVLLMGGPLKAARYIERLANPTVLKRMGGAFEEIDKDDQKKEANHNQHQEALHQEMSAQMLGYLPSPMWGQLVKKAPRKIDKEELQDVMYHGHLASNDALLHIREKADKLKKTFRKHPFIQM